MQRSWSSENLTLFVFDHSYLFFQAETLNTGTQVNVFFEASITVQKKATDYTSLHVH